MKTRNEKRRLRTIQRMIGAAMLAVCAVMLCLCITGATHDDKDGTAIFILVPIAVYMLFTKKILIS